MGSVNLFKPPTMTPPLLPLLPKIAMLDSKRQLQKKTYHIFGLPGAQKTKKQVHVNHAAFLNMNHARNANFLGHRWSWSRPSETVSTSSGCAERWYLPEMFHSHHIHHVRQFWSLGLKDRALKVHDSIPPHLYCLYPDHPPVDSHPWEDQG